jgi:aminomethyltransferase
MPNGCPVDDVIVYRHGPERFLLVVNAGNIEKDFAWLAAQRPEGCKLENESDAWALIALQGPAAQAILTPLAAMDLAAIAFYHFAKGEVAGHAATVSRTGYTGEDGFEIFVPPKQADRVWQAILASGQPAGLIPCGLGARDTLRLEAGMRLYGNDIDETTTALEAGLGWIVAGPRRAQMAAGLTRKLVGFELIDPGIARHGCDVYVDGVAAGKVTSGTQTPTIKKSIGMAYLPIAKTGAGSEFEIDIRGRRARARVVPLPFYRR